MSTTLETTKSYYEEKVGREIENTELLSYLEQDIEISLKYALKINSFNEEEKKIYKANYLFFSRIYETLKKELEV